MNGCSCNIATSRTAVLPVGVGLRGEYPRRETSSSTKPGRRNAHRSRCSPKLRCRGQTSPKSFLCSNRTRERCESPAGYVIQACQAKSTGYQSDRCSAPVRRCSANHAISQCLGVDCALTIRRFCVSFAHSWVQLLTTFSWSAWGGCGCRRFGGRTHAF